MQKPEFLLRLFWCRRGAAAAEMVLVTPLLLVLMFGAVEVGRYFLDEHVALKAVRDGARFAARHKFSEMPCDGQPARAAEIRNLVRFGNIAGTGSPRLRYWTSGAGITFSIRCTTGTWSGIYSENPQGAPVVTVSVTIPYVSLFGGLGFDVSDLRLRAEAQSAVMGI